MKKLLLSVMAVGAMATVGAASAQDVLGSVLPQILGSVLGNNGVLGNYPAGSVYVDQYGRQVQVDQFGNHVLVGPGTNVLGAQGTTVLGGRRVVEDPSGSGRQIVLNADGTYTHPVNGWRMYVTPDGRHVPLGTGASNAVARRSFERDRDRDRIRDNRDRDRDRDGIRDRRDPDRDGDGVRNNRDRYPDDRRYR